MKPFSALKVAASLTLVALAVSVRAQQLDNPAYHTVTMQSSVFAFPSLDTVNAALFASLQDETGATGTSNIIIDASSPLPAGTGFRTGPAAFVKLVPNKAYTLSITGGYFHEGSVVFRPLNSAGVRLLVDGVRSETAGRFTGGTGSSINYTYTIMLVPVGTGSLGDTPAELRGGESTSITIDKPIWYVGLGKLRSGASAGAIGFRQSNFAHPADPTDLTSFFTPAALSYDAPDPTEVDVVKVGGILRQVFSREVLVNIKTVSPTSYQLDVYARSPEIVKVGGLWTIPEAPFVTYVVSQISNGVAIARTEDAITWETSLTYSASTWRRRDWHTSSAPESYVSTTFTSDTEATVAHTGPSATGTPETVLTSTKSFGTYGWGSELTGTVVGELETEYTYYGIGAAGSYVGKLLSATNTDGSWVRYTYYNDSDFESTAATGAIKGVFKPWLDASPVDPASASATNSVSTTFTYFGRDPELPATAITTAPNGNMLSKTTWAYSWDATLNSYLLRTDTRSDYDTATSSVTTVEKRYRATSATPTYLHDKPVSVAFPDGRKDSYAYFEGSWSASTKTFSGATGGEDRLILIFHGQTAAGSQTPAGVERTSWTNGYSRDIDPLYLVTGRSTVSQIVVDTTGRTVFSGEALYNGPGSLVLLSGTLFTYDGHGRLTTEQDVSRSAGTTTRTYQSALLQTVTAPDGVVTKFEYDALLRLYRKTEGFGGGSTTPAKVQETAFDGANRPVETTSCDCGSSTRYSYDSSNRLEWKKEPSPNGGDLTTSYSYPSPQTTTTTLPSGATSTEERYRDGRLKSVTGTAQPAAYYDYTVNSTGLLVTYYAAASADKTNGWSETQADLLGRTKKYSTPAYGWSTSSSSAVIDIASDYGDNTGLLSKQTTTYRASSTKLAPDRLFTYDAAGQLATEGYNLNENTTLDPMSNDRIVVHGYGFVQDGGWWAVKTTATYPVLDSTSLVTTSEAKTRLTGFGSDGIAETVTVDPNGRTTTQVTSVAPATKDATTTVTQVGVSTVQKTRNGYAYEVSTAAGDKVRRRYDTQGRLQYVDSRWTGSAYGATDTYAYFGDTSFVQSQTVGGVNTTYTYGWGGGKHTVSATDAGGTSHVVYNEKGLPWRTYGSGATPTQVTYDTRGRRVSLTTWRSGAFDGADWPSSPGTGDLTQWTPDPATGLVTSKIYPDHSDTRRSRVDFTYTPLGQVMTRKSARGVTTTYDYYDGSTTSTSDVSHRTQELKSITYDDGTTPSITYTYRRSGLPAGVADDVTGARVFTYGASYPFRLEKETLGSFYNRGSDARVRTFTYDGAGRSTGFKLGTEADADVDLSQTLHFDAGTGLLDHLYTAANNGTARTIDYFYETSSSLVDRYSTGSFAANYDYDVTSAARRSVVEGAWSGSARTRFELTYDARGYLRSAKQSGSAFADYTSGTSYSSVYNFHTYDSRGQLQATAMFRNSPPASGTPASADELPGRRFEYRYDLLGNRTTSGPTGSAAGGDDEYTLKTNGLNQYDTKENNTVRVLGTAAANANVGAQSTDHGGSPVALTTNKKDRSFAADVLPLNNASRPAKGSVTAYAAIPGTGGAPDLLKTGPVRAWWIAKQLQSFSYDADGNLTGDGVWTYQYDAENRLIRMESTDAAFTAGLTRWVLEFKYDYMGRRVQKRSNNVDAGTDVYTRYVYDGWNVVAEFSATASSIGTILRSFTWGLDVAGSFAATGGVGALVQLTDHAASKTYFPTYDGSGNVSALVDSADGSLAAVYEYSPFGELLRSEGAYAAANPFRFSTKWTDAETGLSYYGYRYYSPALGRFINRDPIEEQGGLNLYAFAGNNPTTRFDVLGLDPEFYYNLGLYGNTGYGPPPQQWTPSEAASSGPFNARIIPQDFRFRPDGGHWNSDIQRRIDEYWRSRQAPNSTERFSGQPDESYAGLTDVEIRAKVNRFIREGKIRKVNPEETKAIENVIALTGGGKFPGSDRMVNELKSRRYYIDTTLQTKYGPNQVTTWGHTFPTVDGMKGLILLNPAAFDPNQTLIDGKLPFDLSDTLWHENFHNRYPDASEEAVRAFTEAFRNQWIDNH